MNPHTPLSFRRVLGLTSPSDWSIISHLNFKKRQLWTIQLVIINNVYYYDHFNFYIIVYVHSILFRMTDPILVLILLFSSPLYTRFFPVSRCLIDYISLHPHFRSNCYCVLNEPVLVCAENHLVLRLEILVWTERLVRRFIP